MKKMFKLLWVKYISIGMLYFFTTTAFSSTLLIEGTFKNHPRAYINQAEGLNSSYHLRESFGNNINGVAKVTVSLDISGYQLSAGQWFDPFVNRVFIATNSNDDFITIFDCSFCLDGRWITETLNDVVRGPKTMTPFNLFGINSAEVTNNIFEETLNVDLWFNASLGVDYYLFFDMLGAAPDYSITLTSSTAVVPLPISSWLFLFSISLMQMLKLRDSHKLAN